MCVTDISGCILRYPMKFDIVDPASFILVPHTLHVAVGLLPLFTKLLKAKLMTKAQLWEDLVSPSSMHFFICECEHIGKQGK